MSKTKSSIGVFDSGFGGLEILREITAKLPQYNYIYLGDNARAPYGGRSQKVLYQFTKQAVNFLLNKNCHLIVLACNTVSSKALRKIQRQYLKHFHDHTLKVLGVLIPAVEEAVVETKNKRIGVIGTQATISSKTFEKELLELNPKIKVFQKACPLLVSTVESGETSSKTTEIEIKKYMGSLVEKNIDTLILGCTHFGLLEEKIKKIVGKSINLVSEGKVVAEKLKDYLQRHSEVEKCLGKNKKRRFFTTVEVNNFENLGSKFFKRKIKAEKVILK